MPWAAYFGLPVRIMTCDFIIAEKIYDEIQAQKVKNEQQQV